MTPSWTIADMPSQEGRTIVVTGTGGLGFETALAFARAGGDVILAGRDPKKGFESVTHIRRAVPDAIVAFEPLDLADLASVAAFGKRLASRRYAVDVLVNNAGLMTPPRRETTADGFERQFGVNYLGHFALTAHLLPLLRQARAPRVVTLSSIAARQGWIDFDDLQAERHYKPMPVYAQSKLACLMFALELQRRSDEAGWGVTSLAAHPGVSRTNLLHNAPGRFSPQGVVRSALWFLFQPAATGALPTLMAATEPSPRAPYYGPTGLLGLRGAPGTAPAPSRALESHVARKLWDVSEDLTGVRFGEAPWYARNALRVA